MKAAVLGPSDGSPDPTVDARTELTSGPTRTVIGTILDVSPHVLILDTDSGERRFSLAATTVAWRGTALPPAALRHGDCAIVQCNAVRHAVADRIWAEIGRVTGTIVERDGSTLLVDDGTGQGRKILVIPTRAAARIQVRFPRLVPGYLIDVIGLRRQGFLEGLVPGTSQPPYRADQPPRSRPVSGRVPRSFSGTATWHDYDDEPQGLMGVAYPALDPETCCRLHPPRAGAETPTVVTRSSGPHAASLHPSRLHPSGATRVPGTAAHPPATTSAETAADPSEVGLDTADGHAVDPHTIGPGCVPLPYLSIGSRLTVRNDCVNRARMLPVTSCGAVAKLFCDRCVTCGTSPRGRVADLTVAAFVDLGGDLAAGCFNATITIGGQR